MIGEMKINTHMREITVSKEYLEERLDYLRKQNDSTKLSMEQTSVLRGQIKEISEMLSLFDKKEIERTEKVNYDF